MPRMLLPLLLYCSISISLGQPVPYFWNNGVIAHNLGDLSAVLCGTNEILEDQGASWGCIPTPTTSTTTRHIQFEESFVVTSGAPTEVTFDNVTAVQLPNGADSEVNAWFRVPSDAVAANDISLALNFAPNAAPGAVNNKVRLKTTAKVNNTSAGQTVGDTITMADDTDWDDYVGTVNKIAGGTYAVGDLVQMKILRDTTVANNAAVGFNIAQAAWIYTSSQ